MRLRALLAVAVVLCTANSYAATWYVDTKATGSQNGLSWVNAFKTIQAGINAATAGDEIWVGNGTYNETRTAAADGALVLKANVALYGGFQGNVSGTGFETARSQRDWFLYPAIIDGTNGRGAGLAAYHVVDGAAGATLDGFTVQNGNANGASNPTDKRGGGIAIVGFSMTVRNCVIKNNVADNVAGGIICVSSASTIDRCLFQGNLAKSLSNPAGGGGGGAMCIDTATGNTALTNCIFYQNTVTNANSVAGPGGGAVMIAGSISPTFTNCSFGANVSVAATAAPSPGTGSAGGGSAVYVLMGATPAFTNCIFWGDTGGGTEIANHTVAGPGANAAENAALPTLNFCIYQGTYAGVFNNGSNADPIYDNSNASFPLRVTQVSPTVAPGINTGTSSGAPTVDYMGTTRGIRGYAAGTAAWDKGAYETDVEAPTCTGLAQLVNLNSFGTFTLPTVTQIPFGGSTDLGGVKYVKMAKGNTVVGPFTTTIAMNCTDVGSTTISGQITDYAGNVSTCTTTVTTSDVTAPTLNSCAANVSVANQSNSCQALVPNMTTSANFTDACGVTVTQSPAAGSLFSGTQTVTITATDPSNNQTQCTAQITVSDTTPPVFSNCPSAQSVTVNGSCQGTIPNIVALATATDNCGTPTVTQSPAAGTLVTTSTVVTLTASDAQLPTPNTATCLVTVNLSDTTAPQITTCAPAQNVSLNGSCQATVPNVVSLTTATDNCPASLVVTQNPAAGTVLTGAGVRTIVVTATDGGNNTATCNVQLNVNDTTNPTITCPSSVANVNVDGSCTAIAPNLVALTTASDNCGSPVITQSPVAGASIPLGANIFTLTATDVNSNVSTCQVTVNAVDVTAPSITTCAPDRTLSRSGSCDQLVPNLTGEVVAVDNCTASPTITQSPLAGTLITTDTVVTLTATDASSNSSTCTTNLTLVDDSDPVITSCAPPVTVNLDTNCQATVPDLTAGVSSTDNCGVASTTQLPIAGTTITADTIVTLTVRDTSNNIATCQTNVTVTDVIAPTIDTCPAARTLSRSATCNAQVPDLVAETIASDNCTVADISQSPIAGTTITTDTVVTITVTDGFSNTATCTVNLTLVDDTAPVITLNGGANLAYLTGQIYTEQGATASDNCDASVTVTIGGDTVDNQTPGIYIVRYNAVDAAGNNAIEVTRQVTFTLNDPPVITITGSNPAVVECHTSYTDAGATAFDSDQGDITGDMITTGTVDVNTVGDYPIEYKVTDNAFTTVSETRIVQVRDTTAPVVTITGPTTVTHECHTAYSDLGATASDTCYGDITPDITVDNHVDENAVGDYAVNYTVIDGSGNQTTVTRTVQVRDTTIPVLTLIGDNPVDHECGTVYSDLGVFADDSCDGDITALVVVNNPVDENSNTGTYTVTYNVNDISNNSAVQITRTVNVRDTLRPVITLVGTPVVAVNIDTPYVEQGANASDVCDGTDTVTITGTVDVHNRGTYILHYNAVDSNGNNAIEVLRSVVVSGPADPPVILQAPTDLTVNYGVSAQFTVLASSSPTDPVTYRWTRNGVDLSNSAKYSGVTTDTLTINNSANADEANYAVKATNSHGTTPSNSAALTVLDPAITQQPVDAAVPAGSTVNFTVVAVGSPTLQYQWFKDGNPVANGPKYTGATSATLSVTDSQPADQGDYFVRVTGADGNVDSEVAKLKVANPAIISQPVDLTVDPGDTATFVVNVQGTPPILFRWRKNGVNLNDGGRFSGVNTSTLTISNVIEGDEGQYSCVVVGQQIVTSDNARLTVNDPPVLGPIALLPVSGVLARGASGTLTAIIAAGTPPFSFQWKKDGLDINTKSAVNGQSQVLTIQNTVDADAGNYTCVVTNSAGSATAVPVHISVGLTIFADLQDRFAEDGTPFTWSVGVGGAAGNLVYTWFKQDTNSVLQPLSDGPGLSGTQTDVLSFNPVDFGDAGRYQVEVSDTTDTVTSRLAKLTVVSQLPLAGGMGLALLAGAASLLGAKAVRRKKH